MDNPSSVVWIAFVAAQKIAIGSPHSVAGRVKDWVEATPNSMPMVFDANTSQPVEIDLRGSLADVLARLPAPTVSEPAEPTPRLPGRPKLGVVAREVTLLPRHWAWLAAQTGGASVALRKLVEQASRASETVDRQRQAQESAYRFMNAIAGNLSAFEEACRALFAGNLPRLEEITLGWPADIRRHTLQLAAGETITGD